MPSLQGIFLTQGLNRVSLVANSFFEPPRTHEGQSKPGSGAIMVSWGSLLVPKELI